ncbi:PglD-related sugar-binding protein [Arcticibacterium luteifluviistationis]|uniref:Sialic acid O-acetyltransferase n=1 Tax=Arcticibacterium luteifluviistationis TaxID=1784714 RepID=A0A2Z4GF66_9BACT|nr:acetyltransferase [Arcticibacterium luteifluviistationis]AWV99870.1 sialic acid O-acetyltransferase [Arcticibacterium luteifluviistationis]
MKNLIIIGARGFGREVFDLAKNTQAFKDGEYIIKGFLDDKTDALEPYNGYPPILGGVETYEIEKDDVFVCALGTVQPKKHYAQLILDKGGEFINLVDLQANVRSDISHLKGVLIFSFVFVSVDVTLSDFVSIQHFACLGHDAKVGQWSHMSSYSTITGFTVLEEEVMLQTAAKVVPKKTVGKGSMVGAGSLVIKNVKPGESVFGSPARKM